MVVVKEAAVKVVKEVVKVKEAVHHLEVCPVHHLEKEVVED